MTAKYHPWIDKNMVMVDSLFTHVEKKALLCPLLFTSVWTIAPHQKNYGKSRKGNVRGGGFEQLT
jgi:hypothetical protein